MSNTETYEGWENKETWALALYIDNDKPSHEFWMSRGNHYQATKLSNTLVNDFADALASHYDDESGDNLLSCLASCALSRINWKELAEHILQKVREL